MDFEQINQLIKDKKWTDVVFNIEIALSKNNDEEIADLISMFESIDRGFREKNCLNLFLKLWRPALKLGKIKSAKEYSFQAAEILVKFKRTPSLKILLNDLKSAGITKTNPYELTAMVISGHALANQASNKHDYWEQMQMHPEKWKLSKDFLKTYLLQGENWETDHWKLAYEFILNFSFDKDLMFLLADKSEELNKPLSLKKFAQYFTAKNLIYHSATTTPSKKLADDRNAFKIDYDILALQVLSGEATPTLDAQRKVIFSLHDLNESELRLKGNDMLVAFSLLGMELVVIYLSEKLIKITEDVKQRASIHYTCAVALFENQQFHKVIDIVNDVVEIEPLHSEEIMAFEYLKAEALLKLNRSKDARIIFAKIKKWNPHFRLVSQRLTELEAS